MNKDENITPSADLNLSADTTSPDVRNSSADKTLIGIRPDLDKLIFQKNRPLLELSQSKLTLSELKLLDLYISRVDSRNPNRRGVVLEKGEIEEALGLTEISSKNLADILLHLGQGIKISDPSAKKGFRIIWLLEKVKCERDERGTWKVTMEANKQSLNHFFDIENIGYLRYKLRSVAALRSRYSYILFLYLEDNRFRRSWTVDLDELKELLACNNESIYKEYKHFNDGLLKLAQKELYEKTECHFSYEPIEKGRSVIALRFTLEDLPQIASGSDKTPSSDHEFTPEGSYDETTEVL